MTAGKGVWSKTEPVLAKTSREKFTKDTEADVAAAFKGRR